MRSPFLPACPANPAPPSWMYTSHVRQLLRTLMLSEGQRFMALRCIPSIEQSGGQGDCKMQAPKARCRFPTCIPYDPRLCVAPVLMLTCHA